MNLNLRKRHRLMWMVIGIGLPLLCLTAIENIPARPTAEIPRFACPDGITNCGITGEEGDIEHLHLDAFSAGISLQDSVSTITVEVLQPLKSAYTLAYLGSPEQSKDSWRLLGALEGMGNYEFRVNEQFAGEVNITFYDALNEHVLNHLKPTVQ